MLQISVESKDLARAIGVVSRVINKRNTFPILDNVLLTQEDGRFTVTGSNNEAWATMKMPEESITVLSGTTMPIGTRRICLPAEMMKQMLGSCPDQRLTCDIDDESLKMTVAYNSGKFSIPVVAADDFPQPMVKDAKVCAFSLDSGWLVPRVKAAKTSVCSEDNLRPVMANIALDAGHEGVNIVGTDGHTLYKDRLQVGVGGGFLEGEPNVVLLHQSVFGVIEAAFASAESIRIETDGSMVTLRSDNFTLVFRSVEGKYPNYNSVIPRQQSHRVTVNVASLTAAMRRVSIFADAANNMIVIGWDGKDLSLSADDIDYGRHAKESVAPSGDDTDLPFGFKIGMKAASLLSLLGCVKTDTAIMEFTDSTRAMTIREEDANSDLVLLQMPMLIGDEKPKA